MPDLADREMQSRFPIEPDVGLSTAGARLRIPCDI